jgi:hypothetical protein
MPAFSPRKRWAGNKAGDAEITPGEQSNGFDYLYSDPGEAENLISKEFWSRL